MTRRLTLTTHLTVNELHTRYRQATDPVARSHWQIIWLLAQGTSTAQVATATGYSLPWIRALAHRYNHAGPAALGDRRHANPGATSLLTPALQAQLASLLEGPAPDGGIWSGPKVATWMAEHLGQPVHPQRGWEVLRRLGFTLQRLRPRHTQAEPEAQAAFKQSSQP
jgi:transposase